MPINDELIERMFRANKALIASGMGGLSNDEIRSEVSKTTQRPASNLLAPMPETQRLGGGTIQSQLPIAGFQGNAVFPNQSGSGLLQAGNIPPRQEPYGMDFNVRLGPDGRPQQILLRRIEGQRRPV